MKEDAHLSIWAWRQQVGSPTAKVVLLFLAQRADDKNSCWTGPRTIAKATELSVTTVRKALGYLVKVGLLIKSDRSRENGSQTTCKLILIKRELTQMPRAKGKRKAKKVADPLSAGDIPPIAPRYSPLSPRDTPESSIVSNPEEEAFSFNKQNRTGALLMAADRFNRYEQTVTLTASRQ